MKKNLLFVAVAIIVPVIFIVLRRNSAPIFSAQEYQCVQTHDTLLSDNYFSSINTALAGLCKDRCAAHVIIDRLQQQFSVLKKVVIAYRPSGTQVMISAYEPLCMVNNSDVFTKHKEFFSKNIFAKDAVAEIPSIEVAQDNVASASKHVLHLLQTLPSHMYQTYNLELMNEHCLRFTDKQKPQFIILSSVSQTKFPQLLTQCELIKHSIDEKKGFEKGATWIADTRFAHYIVAYKA